MYGPAFVTGQTIGHRFMLTALTFGYQ